MSETKAQELLPEATRQPKTVPMKWLELGVAKDPEFNKKIFFYDPKSNDHFFAGYLVASNKTSKGVEYKFQFDGFGDSGDEVFTTTATHFAICKPPVE